MASRVVVLLLINTSLDGLTSISVVTCLFLLISSRLSTLLSLPRRLSSRGSCYGGYPPDALIVNSFVDCVAGFPHKALVLVVICLLLLLLRCQLSSRIATCCLLLFGSPAGYPHGALCSCRTGGTWCSGATWCTLQSIACRLALVVAC